MKERIITAIDIGSTKVCAIISVINSENKLEIRGVGTSESQGIEKGIVNDLKATSDSIIKAIEQAEDNSKLEAENLFVGIAGDYIEYRSTTGRISIANGNQPCEINETHVEQVINDSKLTLKLQSGSEQYDILHCIPQFFSIDKQDGVYNPIGMIGIALSVNTLVILAAINPLRNLRKAFEMAGFSDIHFVLSTIATSKSVLNDDEKQLGSLLIDIGGGTTDLLIFKNKCIHLTRSIGYGGTAITNDLSIGLRTPPKFAESIKVEYGNAVAATVDYETTVSIEGIGGRPPVIKQLRLVSDYIEARLRDILDESYKLLLNNYRGLESLTGGIILTGGSSQMMNISALCEEIFNMPVRIGYPDLSIVNGAVSRINSPEFSTVIGLLYYAFDQYKEDSSSTKSNSNILKNIKNPFRNLIKLFSDFS